MATNIPSVTLYSKFLALPLELRLQVYEEYISKCSGLDIKRIHEDILPSEYSNFTLPPLLVSKQTSEEVLDLLRRRKHNVYRITWQEAGFDGLAKASV